MYLKKIVMSGFKSFADNTVIDLDKNISGIVGPNGSGKSNVVDAIRWVLGEQSVKSLRGDGNMTDVIFAGSKSRNAMGVASVTLVFDNNDSYLPLSYSEIAIKRRLYKDGSNEFYLNNERVRLKDITNLLIDSGIAKESFNIIGQGRIEEILSSKPEDRRVIFEEASGVLKYKKRKEEALRKLERTHNNMNRVSDIIKEMEERIEPLREQKHKAIQYLDWSEELKKLEIALITADTTKIHNNYQLIKDKIDNLTIELTKISTNNRVGEAKIEEYKGQISKTDEEIRVAQNKLVELSAEVEKINGQKELILSRQKYQVSDTKLHDQLVSLRETELKLQNELADYNTQVQQSIKEKQTIQEKIDKNLALIKKEKDNKENIGQILTEYIRNRQKLKTRIEILTDNIENGDGLPFAVKSILNHPNIKGIHNTIGNIIEVNNDYGIAISTVLGASANFVIVDNEKIAKEAIEYLKDKKIGRVTFFPLNIIKGKDVDLETIKMLSSSSGYIDIASNLVQNEDKYNNIVKNQLGNVLVVDNIDNANIIAAKINYRYRIVTLDGELLHVGGSLTGGSIKQRNIISDKQELEKLVSDDKDIQKKISELENKINEIDYNLKSFEDTDYLYQRSRVQIDELIDSKNRQILDLNTTLSSCQNEISGAKHMMDNTLEEETEEILKKYYDKVREKEELSNSLSLLQNRKIDLDNNLKEYEYSVKKENNLYYTQSKQLKNLEIELNRSDVKLDHLLTVLNEEYNMTYEYALANYKLEMDNDKAKNRITNLKNSIKELGNINLNAPEEYDTLSERYEFLIHQQEDLTNAENTLLQIIEEMDEIMKRDFEKTFKVIAKNFETTFRELFNGGKASLKLTNPNNILETGIEIVASPPGKSLKSISLLSGGEKTFTAISLLFAILKSRPVPFCVLDEVEAALDEVNVGSFGNYLRNLNTSTQFIVITHKKKTMEYADVLYGITMQESGVSKLVSVKLVDL